MAQPISSGNNPGAWSGNNPAAITQAQMPKRKRAIPSRPATAHNPKLAKWQCPVEFSQFIDSITPKPFTHTLPPRSKMMHGVRVDIKGVLNVYVELVKALPAHFKKATAINPVPKTGYIDLGFSTAKDAAEAVSLNLNYQGTQIPLQRTRYNQEPGTFVNIHGLPTTLPAATVKAELREGLQKYGDVKELIFEENDLLPGFIGSKAFVTFGKVNPPPTTKYSVVLPSKVYFSSAPLEIVTLNIEGQKIRKEKPVLLGEFHLKAVPTTTTTTPQTNLKISGMENVQNSPDPELLIANDIIENNQLGDDPYPDSDQMCDDSNVTPSGTFPIVGDGSEDYHDPDHIYPVFPKSVANDQRYEIYQMREGLFDITDAIINTKQQVNKHMETYNPHHPATITRFVNIINNHVQMLAKQYQEYCDLLRIHIPDEVDPDPEMLKQVQKHSMEYNIPELLN